MLQRKKPSDYVIATGKQFTVKQFVNLVLKELNFKFKWKGKGLMKNVLIVRATVLWHVVKNILDH